MSIRLDKLIKVCYNESSKKKGLNMKTIEEMLAEIDLLCPNTKGSEKLFIVGMLQDAYRDGYKDATEKHLAFMEELSDK